MLQEALLRKWSAVRAGLLDVVDKFAEAELDFRPVADGYSAGDVMRHIAHEEEIEVAYGLAQAVASLPSAFERDDFATKEAVLRLLEETHARSLRYLESLGDAELEAEFTAPWGATGRRIDALLHVLEHEIHHRGELSLMLGLLGRQGLDA
ncbi:MAG TPA: DinB family protein [Dehalococcoidia bacterium]|nr:DinB family protein [Dehalococcoidia bacterium]